MRNVLSQDEAADEVMRWSGLAAMGAKHERVETSLAAVIQRTTRQQCRTVQTDNAVCYYYLASAAVAVDSSHLIHVLLFLPISTIESGVS